LSKSLVTSSTTYYGPDSGERPWRDNRL